jgi:predicted  nucleic acid-binding Zn-ribbon protein
MLEQLSHVQARDLDLDVLGDEKRKKPPELTTMRRDKEDLQAVLSSAQKRHQELAKEVNANELELKALDGRRKAATAAAIAAGNGKEASQYQNQELQFATRVQELEEDTLPLIESMEKVGGEVDELQRQLGELEPQLQAMIATEDARIASLDEKIAVLAGQRDALAREVDAPLLKQYEQVRRAKRGLGLVNITSNQRCGGCNMQLPIYVVQRVKAGQGVTRCPSCGRILWLGE